MALPASRAVAQRCLNYCSNELWRSHSTSDPRRPNVISEKDQVGSAAMPDIPLKDLQGREVTVGRYKGKVVLVNFWATWCSPCLAEMPWLIDFQQKYGSRGFTVLVVSLDADGEKSVLPFVEGYRFDVNNEKQALDYPILLGSSEVGEEFGGIIGLPTSMLFSREGKKIKTVNGIMTRDEMEKAIQNLL
jgi:thiol-disulfide isomerase/thioredoxin